MLTMLTMNVLEQTRELGILRAVGLKRGQLRKLIFAQVMEFAPWHTFRRLVAKYHGDFNIRTFNCVDQFLCMAFAQLTYRESLRDVEACLPAVPHPATTSDMPACRAST